MRKERGAIVVEATIALTAFIFAIFTILSIVNICFIQAKVGVSLNTAAKEISQYSYLYYAFGADGLDAKLSSGTEGSKQLAKDTIDGGGRSEGKKKTGLQQNKKIAPTASAAGAQRVKKADFCSAPEPPLCKGRWVAERRLGGVV